MLEIGCGPGIDLVQLAGAGACVTGMDLTPPAVRLARRHLQISKLPGSVLEGNAELTPFADGTFDAVYSHGVLHHTVDTQRAIDEVHRVLKPGGEAVIMLYHRVSWFWLLSKVTERRSSTPTPTRRSSASTRPAEVRRLFHAFQSVDVTTERFPAKTKKFKDGRDWASTGCSCRYSTRCRRRITARWGWHLMIYAQPSSLCATGPGRAGRCGRGAPR